MVEERATAVGRRSLLFLAALNFFLADARDGLGPFLDAFLATRGWSPVALGAIATVGGLIGLAVTPAFGALVDGTRYKRALVAGPVIVVTAVGLATLVAPTPSVVWLGQVGTAVVGAVIGPALTGLTLGLMGPRLFGRQIARNEFWNHAGNVVSLAAVFVTVTLYGEHAIVTLMVVTAVGAVVAAAMIDPARIDHDAARGLDEAGAAAAPSGFRVLFATRGLLLLALVLLLFHFGNAPMSRLVAQDFAIELGTPFRTTAIITGVSQVAMIAMAVLAPMMIRRFGLSAVLLIALGALPVRGLIAGTNSGFWTIFPVQTLDGVGAGLIGIATPIAVEGLLAGSGRFNVGLAAVMTMQGVGASLSNVVAGSVVGAYGYEASHLLIAVVAVVAVGLFLRFRKVIAPGRRDPVGDAAAMRAR
ncbi:MFS transporter [Mycolicibacterium chubuense]|uniref:Major Facilitator Superfamily protein n=1 Tax=Mycolicibacterium chubuense TaxID=1800 RepID=A0A0J6WRI7_MYCCU|nr:MFS transporter [Mycolicibacterium chubuense]KMO84367.1 Major Facilitator Superfamily protein [Mycolicibacterium chubuense]ORA46270.1 MFS transporter [Mycolicibacterium chubuense]SPY00458.1 MFS transporter [Mycolicibacterium chubuense]